MSDDDRFEKGIAIRKELGMHTKPGPNVDLAFFRMTASDLFGNVFARPGLELRDREMITTAVIIAIGGSHENLSNHLRSLREIGFSDDQIREIIVQSTYYCGWPRGAAANQMFNRVIAADPAPPTPIEMAPTGRKLDDPTEKREAGDRLALEIGMNGKPNGVDEMFKALTQAELIGGVFTRPGLVLRDRVMIALAATIAAGGDPGYLADHFRAAMSIGFSDAEIREIVVQTMYYCGWPRGAAANQVYNSIASQTHHRDTMA